MSGTAAVPNTFASAVTATGLQLDNNFTTIVAYVNDPTNRNNYAADAGSTNTVVTTFAPPVVGGYTAGLELTWKWAATNSGGVVVNANGLGNVALVNPDGSALAPGQGVQGSIGKAVSDGTRAIFIGPPASATKAMMQTATLTAGAYVSPQATLYAPGAAKAWGVWQGTATGVITALGSYGITRIEKGGAGTYTVTLSNAMSSTAWVAIGTAGSVSFRIVMVRGFTTTSCVMIVHDGANPNDADLNVYFSAYGTLA